MERPQFRPRKFLFGKHLQTIYSAFFPPVNKLRSKYYCEDILLTLSDSSGDTLWLEHNPPLSTYRNGEKPWNGSYIVMIHGMEGSSESHYLVSLASSALKKGYGTIRVNLRGCGRGKGLSKFTYYAGQTGDVQDILDFVNGSLSTKIFLSGFSLSANLVLKYFGENRTHKALAFSAVSPPLDLSKNCEYIDSLSGRFYRNYFLSSFRKKIKEGVLQLSPQILKDLEKIRTFFDFDDFVTAPMFGYRSALDFYRENSSKDYIPKIKHPGILIHAEDDPVVPPLQWKAIPWSRLPNLSVLLTKKGGHVGFLSEPSPEVPDGRWVTKILLDYFDSKL
ncbi:YheT family hydrolase [Leptospira perolatii]|uniref:Alpha/beta hydrolase n=1 Tax=Leptospira perolatii TaxID=2023191 RepID=A0ABX4P8P8_9LEPT|nr:alpha/beta fold hydrolase [Leptospira perolatii]PJZ68397.1 alpha/beta hydrolase [Leptospira perolatii]